MAAANRPLVVCIIGDEAMLRTVARCLNREPLEVRGTRSMAEALRWIAGDEVAVVVSDHDVPEMTAPPLTARAGRIRPETVRILLTGKRSHATAIEGLDPGEVFRIINKPFDSEQLRGAVHAAVARHRELLVMSGDLQRRERREALRLALEAEYPGISQVARDRDGVYEITADPWGEAAELGLADLTAKLEPGSS